ncbi:MAG: hypothetical protein ACKVQR_01465 [Aquabacterium sp.]
MNAPATTAEVELVDIIDFKWLMAHEGHKVHVERLQRDTGYARTCLDLASASGNAALKAAGLKLLRLLPAA